MGQMGRTAAECFPDCIKGLLPRRAGCLPRQFGQLDGRRPFHFCPESVRGCELFIVHARIMAHRETDKKPTVVFLA